jgi:hypothetical protein
MRDEEIVNVGEASRAIHSKGSEECKAEKRVSADHIVLLLGTHKGKRRCASVKRTIKKGMENR